MDELYGIKETKVILLPLLEKAARRYFLQKSICYQELQMSSQDHGRSMITNSLSIIPARYEHVPIWRTHGKYRKQMKLGYSKLLYNQRNNEP